MDKLKRTLSQRNVSVHYKMKKDKTSQREKRTPAKKERRKDKSSDDRDDAKTKRKRAGSAIVGRDQEGKDDPREGRGDAKGKNCHYVSYSGLGEREEDEAEGHTSSRDARKDKLKLRSSKEKPENPKDWKTKMISPLRWRRGKEKVMTLQG